MSIQRFRHHGGHGDSWCISEHVNGELVLYADHVAAVAEAERLAVEQYQTAMRPVDVRATQLAIQRGVADERARIRAAVQAEFDRQLQTSTDKALYFFEADDDDPSIGHDVTFHWRSVLAIIDEEES